MLDELIPRAVPDAAGLEEIRAGLAAVFERPFGPLRGAGLTVEPDGVDAGLVRWMMHLVDDQGEIAAYIARGAVRDTAGGLQVEHEFFEVRSDLRGRGIGRLFGVYSEQWYRESGVQVHTLTAGVDDGGYVWARSGYDWGRADAPRDPIRRLRNAIARGEGTPQELAQAREVLERMERGDVTAPDYPSPEQVAIIGMTEELDGLSSRDPRKTWLGRRVMKGSTWRGQKAP